jgi:PAS domain-containing protein
MGNVLQFPTVRGAGGVQPGAAMGAAGGGGGIMDLNSAGASDTHTNPNQMPKDLKGKALWFLDHQLMPYFYALNLKHEWRMIGIGAFAAFALANLVVTVYPLMEQNRANVVKETGRRASFMARQIAERNGPLMAARAESKAEVGSIEMAEGVRLAVLTDLDSRIIAPATRLNQYLTSGVEATFAVKAKDAFRAGRETGLVRELDDSTICAIEPVRIVSQSAGRNVTVGMAVVSIDTSLATPDIGETGMVYAETLILTGLIGGIILLLLYRITLKPLQVLNDDMDKVLKGDMGQVTHEFKFEELNQLWDIINSALQRVPRGDSAGGGDGMGGLSSGPTAEDFAGPIRMLGGIAKFGLAILDADKKIVFLNPMFEEVTGIRADGAIGQEFGQVARDQSLSPFTSELMDRAVVGSDGVSEDYDFSGTSFKCHAASFGMGGGPARCYVMAIVRNDG